MKLPKLPKLPKLGKVTGLVTANKTAILAVAVGAMVAVPTTLYIAERQKNSEQPTQATEQAKDVAQTEQNTTDAETTTPEATPQQANSTGGTTPTNNNRSTQNSSSPTPQTATPTPTPATPTPTPDPTTLANCFYQNGEKAGQNCPYSPPPSWSSIALYNCYNGSGNFVACSPYTDTVSISSDHYLESGNTPTHFCVFNFKNGTYKFTRVNISSDIANIRCHSDQAFTYDPWAN